MTTPTPQPTTVDEGSDLGDGYNRWVSGLESSSHFAALRDEFLIYVIGPIIRYVKLDKKSALEKIKVLRTFEHGFDDVCYLETNPLRDVYALAERSMNPRVYVYHIDRHHRIPTDPQIVAKLTGIKANQIRAVRFTKKDLVIVLTGYPTFGLSIWKWTTEQELIVALNNEPSVFSDLVINPINDCHWVEFGDHHLTFYDLQSFTKNDVVRTQIHLPVRYHRFDQPDPLMGREYAMTVVSACFSHYGVFYLLDDHMGLHTLHHENKLLTWVCTIGSPTRPNPTYRLVSYGSGFAELREDGWLVAYELDDTTGKLTVISTIKLRGKVLRWMQFPELKSNETFYALLESRGLLEIVEDGVQERPIPIPDLMFRNVKGLAFIEPRCEHLAVIENTGRIWLMEAETGNLLDKWRLPYVVESVLCHPVLPLVFCGTAYGTVNVLDIRSLRYPKLISKTYLSREKNSRISKLAWVSQGCYLVSADTENDRIFLQYGYPFEDFEFLDMAKLPGEIRQLNVPGCGARDLRLQVVLYSRDKVDEICPVCIFNFSVNHGRLTMVASQLIESPILSLAMAPNKNFLYTYHVDMKKLGFTPYCDDNSSLVLPKPSCCLDDVLAHDINKMITHGDKLYTFGDDGALRVYEAPAYSDNEDAGLKLKLVNSVCTHLGVQGGITDGVISLDGTQAVTIGATGCFVRVRLKPKQRNPPWELLGFGRHPDKLLKHQMASFDIDQQRLKSKNNNKEVRVNHAIRDEESTAPESWAKFDYNLMQKFNSPKAEKLQFELDKVMEYYTQILMRNMQKEKEYRIDMSEFNIDEDVAEQLDKKRENYVKYSHIKMRAINNLRKKKIKFLKNLLWDRYKHKGRLFMGFTTTTEVASYPLLSREATFGRAYSQTAEERRLELCIQAEEPEVLASAFSLSKKIMKIIIQSLDIASRHLYVNLDQYEYEIDQNTDARASQFGDLMLSDLDKKAFDQQFAETAPGEIPSRIAQLSAKEKWAYAKDKLSRIRMFVQKGDRVSGEVNQDQLINLRIEEKPVEKPLSAIRQRMASRRRLKSRRPQSLTQEENDLLRPKAKMKLSRAKSRKTGEGDAAALSQAPTVAEFMKLMKPTKTHITPHGVFGPRGRRWRMTTTGDMSKVNVLMEVGPGRRQRKKSHALPEKRKKKKGKKKRSLEDQEPEHKIQSEDDLDESLGEFDEVIMERHKKYSEAGTPLSYIYKVFSGNLNHELQDMYGYQGGQLCYHQFEMNARHKQVRQMTMIQDEIYRLKEFFNGLFDEAVEFKKTVLFEMAVRNERIREIFYYLELDLDIVDDELNVKEKPREVFVLRNRDLPEAYQRPDSALREEDDEAEAEDEGEEEDEEEEQEMLSHLMEEYDMETNPGEDHSDSSLFSPVVEEVGEESADAEEEGEGALELFSGEELGEQLDNWEMGGEAVEIPELAGEFAALEEGLGEWLDGSDTGQIAAPPPANTEVGGSTALLEEELEAQETFDTEAGEDDEAFEAEEPEEPEEVRKEELLLRPLPKPAFMLEKDPLQFTLDEEELARKYAEKLEERQMIRETLMRELRQLYRENAMSYHSIDLKLEELQLAKKQFGLNILLGELALVRTVKLLRIADDCQQEEDRINKLLAKLQDSMKSLHVLVAQLTTRKNEARKKSAELVERQKDLERKFRRDLGDVGNHLEYFLRNYKRKPKILAKGLDKAEVYEVGLIALKSSNIRAYGRDNGEVAKAVVMAIMDIEDPMLMPSGCPRAYWDRFVKLRRLRLACDFGMKSLTVEIKHISEGLEECKGREEETAKAMAAMLAVMSHRTELKNYFLYNTEFQFLLGKGHVEIDFSEVVNHENCVMTLSKNIEKINAATTAAAEAYIQDIRKTTCVHREVKEIEWRFMVVRLALKDAKELLRDVMSIRPKRELLKILRLGLNLDTLFEDRLNLLRRLQATSAKYHKTFVSRQKKIKRSYENKRNRQMSENNNLRDWLKSENRITSILKMKAFKLAPETTQRKYNEKIQKFLIKRYMKRKINENTHIIKFLEKELGRYYQKSYPCL